MSMPLVRSRQAELLQRTLEGRPPERSRSGRSGSSGSALVGGYAEIAGRLSDLPMTRLEPDPTYRAELHSRLLELATARSSTATQPVRSTQRSRSSQTSQTRHRQSAAGQGRSVAWSGRPRRVITATLAALLTLVVGAGFASASALPGGLLYPVKELVQSAQVHLARGDLDRGQVLLRQASSHISDASTLVGQGDPDPADVNTALGSASTDLGRANTLLMATYARGHDPAALTDLARFDTAQSSVLGQLSGRVPVVSEPLVASLLAQLGQGASTLRAVTALCGAACSTVPVAGLPGPDGLPSTATASNTSSAASGAAGSTPGPGASALASAGRKAPSDLASGLGGLLGTTAGGTGASPSSDGVASIGSSGVGVHLPGVGATVPAPKLGAPSGAPSVGVPGASVTLGPITATLPGVSVSLPFG